MILHLGGAYGDKAATIERFKTNYARLSEPVKRRLVLENDDMSWSVTDLLPLCQELNIPLVLDWHHHNIVRDEEQFREGSLDILPLLPAIAETWTRKGIKQKMHISEARLPNHPLPSQRRSHSARVYHLPPCADDMDIMIEAKDKEQAVFELSKTYNLGNPPLPEEVVGDGPGAKGDEAYWPEGQAHRLKTTKPRVKKEPQYDSEGELIKPSPKKRIKKVEAVKDEPVSDGDQLEPDIADEKIKPPPQKRVKKTKAIKDEPIEDEDKTEASPAGVLSTEAKSKAKPRRARKSQPVQEPEAVPEHAAATDIELRTGMTAKAIVDEAYDRVMAKESSKALRRTSSRKASANAAQ